MPVPCMAAVCVGNTGRLAGHRDADRIDPDDQRHSMKAIHLVKSPYTSLVINFVYVLGNCTVGFLSCSWWFITVGAYYAILAMARFSVLQVRGNSNIQYFNGNSGMAHCAASGNQSHWREKGRNGEI